MRNAGVVAAQKRGRINKEWLVVLIETATDADL